MAHPRKFTEEYRQAELRRGEESLFYFGKTILGYSDFDDWDYELMAALEGRPPYEPWFYFLLSKYRSGRKSTAATMTYTQWRTFYIENLSVKIIEGSSDNAKYNHFLPIIDLWTTSPRADYLNWLYKHRIIPGWKGTNSERFVLVKTDPLANDAISYWGVNSKFEGWHGDIVVIDDAQGTDNPDSEVGAAEAHRAYDRAVPLLKDPAKGQVIVVGVGPIGGRRSFIHEKRDEYLEIIGEAA